jgi:hypothetical protein
MLRSFDADGKVVPKDSADKKILELIKVYKSSQDEILTLTGQTSLKEAIKSVHDLGVREQLW